MPVQLNKKWIKAGVGILALALGLGVHVLNAAEYSIAELEVNSLEHDKLKLDERADFFGQRDFEVFENYSSLPYGDLECDCAAAVGLKPEQILRQANALVANDSNALQCCNFSIVKLESGGRSFIEIRDYRSQLNFHMALGPDQKCYKITLAPAFEEWNSQLIRTGAVSLRQHLKLILATYEYVLIPGDGTADYLAKDLGDRFLIAAVHGSIKQPTSIEFQIYKKDKYFLWLS